MPTTIKRALKFNHVDAHMARFIIVADEKGEKDIISKREIVLRPDLFPKDFEVAEYDVSGSIEINVSVKKKKKV